MATRSQQLLTEAAQAVAERLARRASLRLVLSAAVLCLADQTAEKREYYLDLAASPSSDSQLRKLRQKELDKIRHHLLSNPGLSAADKKRVEQLLLTLQKLYVEESSQST